MAIRLQKNNENLNRLAVSAGYLSDYGAEVAIASGQRDLEKSSLMGAAMKINETFAKKIADIYLGKGRLGSDFEKETRGSAGSTLLGQLKGLIGGAARGDFLNQETGQFDIEKIDTLLKKLAKTSNEDTGVLIQVVS